jgi:hypothetical protein
VARRGQADPVEDRLAHRLGSIASVGELRQVADRPEAPDGAAVGSFRLGEDP